MEKMDQVEKSDSKRNKKGKAKKQGSAVEVNRLQFLIGDLEKERDELKDLLLRKAAEFDNFKRRTENEQAMCIENANARLITELLPVLDNFERSIVAVQGKDDFDGLRNGVDLIYNNLKSVLEEYGVETIQAVGEEFDPEKHDALMQVAHDDYPSGAVVDEHLKGYVMNDRVLRHAQVLVCK